MKENTLSPHCLVGFDGFIDNIISPVKKRDEKGPHPFLFIEDFAEKIKSAKDKSCNIELFIKEQRIGGNAPLLALALAKLGGNVTLIASIGKNSPLPLFQPLTSVCKEVISYESPGESDALEFLDGKIILGKMGALPDITAKKLIEYIGREKLIHLIANCKLFAAVNWTMLPMMNDLFKELLTFNIENRPYLFVDLADPGKRSDIDLIEALNLLNKLNTPFSVVLGLNEAENERVENTKIPLNLDLLFIHTHKIAKFKSKYEEKKVPIPYTEKPKLLTGAGDHFNAGVLYALLNDLGKEEALIYGVAVSNFYVKEGYSPSLTDIREAHELLKKLL